MPKGYITKTFTHNHKRYYVYGKTEEEAIEKKILKKQELEKIHHLEQGNMTVKDWAYKAVDAYKTNQKDVTRETYLQAMNAHVIKHLGVYTLKSVRSIDCQNILNKLQGYSTAYINRIYQILVFIFDTAVRNNYIAVNPAINITKPKGTTKKRRAITDEERNALYQVYKSNAEYLPFIVMLECGLRPSEIRELKHEDIQTIKGKTVIHVNGTKTEKADRFVPVPPHLYEKLIKSNGYVFRNRHDLPYNKQSFMRLTSRLREDMNRIIRAEKIEIKYMTPTGQERKRKEFIGELPLASDFVPYCLRHTYCTDLKDKGVDIRDAQYLMGHADITTTANIYTHGSADTALKVADVIEKYNTLYNT